MHIGEVRARAIKDLRRARDFGGVSDLTRVDGIGPSRLRDIEQERLACVR